MKKTENTQGMKRVEINLIENYETTTVIELLIQPGTSVIHLKMQLEVPHTFLLRQQTDGKVIFNDQDLYEVIQDGDELLLSQPIMVG